LYRQYRPLTRADVVEACAPILLEIAAVLRDDQRRVSTAALHDLEVFLTSKIVLPPYNDNPISARWVVQELRGQFPV
jgi:hypothetical protein